MSFGLECLNLYAFCGWLVLDTPFPYSDGSSDNEEDDVSQEDSSRRRKVANMMKFIHKHLSFVYYHYFNWFS